MEFKEREEPMYTTDPYYDLTDGGYLKPEFLLENQEDIDRVLAAIDTLKKFIEDAKDQNVLIIE